MAALRISVRSSERAFVRSTGWPIRATFRIDMILRIIPAWLRRSRSELADDRGHQHGRIFTRHPDKLLIVGQGLRIGAIGDAADDQTRHAELTAGLDEGRAFHFNRAGAEARSQFFPVTAVRHE